MALFARPGIRGRPAQSLAFNDNLKVTISFNDETLPSGEEGSKGMAHSKQMIHRHLVLHVRQQL